MRWSEPVTIGRPREVVLSAVVDAYEVMAWSAWPQATGFTCSVDRDGTSVGSQIVFRSKDGREQGGQRLTAVGDTRVEYWLRTRGPGGREMTPSVDFTLAKCAASPGSTRVTMHFQGDVPLPTPLRQVVEAGLGRRVRALHIQDLRDLTAHVDSQPVTQ